MQSWALPRGDGFCHTSPCRARICDALPCRAGLCHALPCRAGIHHAEPGFSMQSRALPRGAGVCHAFPCRAELCRAEPGFAVLCRSGLGGREAGPWHGATRVNILLERRLLARGHPQPLEHREIQGPEPAPGSPFLVPPPRRLRQPPAHGPPPRPLAGHPVRGRVPPLWLPVTSLSPCARTPPAVPPRGGGRAALDARVPPGTCSGVGVGAEPWLPQGEICGLVEFSTSKTTESRGRAGAAGHSPGRGHSPCLWHTPASPGLRLGTMGCSGGPVAPLSPRMSPGHLPWVAPIPTRAVSLSHAAASLQGCPCPPQSAALRGN
ncbi:uncharacterized protein LOC142364319 [Opisthocomus hoazin]|uniref:uncharacterized protein LOC142364319 n=1 Tax=Opisthocomus hoazin TaxID=30419 RepID=UPI003F53DDC6